VPPTTHVVVDVALRLAYVTGAHRCNLPILRLHPVAANHPGSTQLADQRPEAAHPASAEGQPVPTVPGPAAASGAGVVEGPTGGRSEERRVGKEWRTGGPPRQSESENSERAE